MTTLADDLRVIANHLHDRFDALVPNAAKRLRLAARRLEALDGLQEAADDVVEAEDDFRAGMPPEWEGDPLTDACARLKDALVKLTEERGAS